MVDGSGAQRVLGFLGAALCASAVPAQAHEQLREDLRESAHAVRFPTYLAAFLGLSEDAEMSGGRMRVDEGDTVSRR